MSECGGLCRWCFGFIFTLGLAALFIWLSLRPSSPSLFINDLSLSNANLSFHLRIKNENKNKGVYYDNITLSFSSNFSRPLGPNITFPAFYQGHAKKANRWGSFLADKKGLPANGTAAKIEVRLETKVRYKIYGIKTGRHGLKLHGEVKVDEQGKKVGKKGVKLRSAGPPLHRQAAVSGSATFLLILFFLPIIF